MIPEAEATGRCEVRPDSYVVRVETDKRGRASGVVYFDRQKRRQFQKARAVVLCANGGETPRLLLMSASQRFPDGLANSSGTRVAGCPPAISRRQANVVRSVAIAVSTRAWAVRFAQT